MARVRVGIRKGSLSNSLLLDLNGGEIAAYSLRKLKASYTGPVIRVRRSIDNSELDIYYLNNTLDYISLSVFCYGFNGYVVKWYDQSGNGYHAQQAVLNNQPKIYDSIEGLVKINGNYSIKFDGISSQLIQEIPEFTSTTSLFGVSKITNLTQNTYWGNYNDSSYGSCLGIVNGSTRIQNINNTYRNYSEKFTTNFALETFIRDISNNWTWYEQSTSKGTKTLAGGMNLTSIGARYGASARLWSDAYLCELIYYPIDKSLERIDIENNINSHYNIY